MLTDIDVAATLKKKLNAEMPPYRILGACNPPLAHRALQAEPPIGLLLPCNVVVRQDEKGSVHVEFMDPAAVLDLVNKPEISLLANEVRQRLERVLAALSWFLGRRLCPVYGARAERNNKMLGENPSRGIFSKRDGLKRCCVPGCMGDSVDMVIKGV